MLHALRPYAHQTDVYLSPHAQTQNFNGAWELVRGFAGVFKRTSLDHVAHAYDLVWLVSPDYELQDNIKMLEVRRGRSRRTQLESRRVGVRVLP